MVDRATRKQLKEQRKQEKSAAWVAKWNEKYRAAVEEHRAAVAAHAASRLEPGERVLASISVERAGKNKTNDLVGQLFNAPGNLKRTKAAAGTAAALGIPDAPNMVLGATDRRLLIFAESLGSRALGDGARGYGRPGDYLGQVRYGRLVGTKRIEARAVSNGVTTAGAVVLDLDDGAQHQLTCWRHGGILLSEWGPIADFVIIVNQAVAAARGPA